MNKKNKITLLVIISFIGVIFWKKETLINNTQFLLQSPCERILEYKIGKVDDEFNVSETTLIEKSQQAAAIWNTYQEQPLLEYNPQAILTVNLTYDERQSLRNQIVEFEEELDSEKTNYESKKQLYDQLVITFEQDLFTLNNEIAIWNEKGGAPPEIYQELTNRRQELASTASQINNLAKELNLSVAEYNADVTTLQETIINYNQNLTQTPEEGIYSASENKIEIYFYVDEQEFIHTLAHEFGHALNLMHTDDNPNAIMYPYTTDIITLHSDDIEQLDTYCQKKTYQIIMKDLGNNLKFTFDNILTFTI